jgi:hypothetical protein
MFNTLLFNDICRFVSVHEPLALRPGLAYDLNRAFPASGARRVTASP